MQRGFEDESETQKQKFRKTVAARLASRRSVEDTQKGRENEPAVAWLSMKPDAGFLYAEHRTYNNEYSTCGGK